jgi:hypothetical protein
MAIAYRERFSIPPLPVDAATASAMGQHFAQKLAQVGGLDALVAKVTDGILTRPAGDPPTALSRLNRLYAQVYTREEIEGLARNTLAGLKIGG